MNILSLFDGISVARQAFHNADIPINKYYCCEIDKYAIQVSKKNWSDNIHLGNVIDFSNTSLDIDFLIGGSPCQDLSIAKKNRKGLDGERSRLFWEYVRIKDLIKPKYFMLENVASMSKKDKDIITEAMGVEPVMFNASLVSAQCRKRLFWTNINFDLPEDRGILLKNILQEDGMVDDINGKLPALNVICNSKINDTSKFKQIGHIGKLNQKYKVGNTHGGQANRVYSVEAKSPTINQSSALIKVGNINNSNSQGYQVYSVEGKSVSLCANGGGLGAQTGLYDINNIRKLTPIECERLQSLPDNYTDCVSNTQRYKCLGNAFNCKVIEHILLHI